MRSMVELRADGAVAARRGAPDEDLTSATQDFLRIGKNLGQSMGLNDLVQLRILQGDEAITFAEAGDRRVGLIHHDDLEHLLRIEHGT